MKINRRGAFAIAVSTLLAAFTLYQMIKLLFYSVDMPDTRMYRGFMIDCSRQFFNTSVLISIIDQLAINNYTHLHIGLSNNECFSYLSSFDNGRLAKADGNIQYLTPDDIQKIVQYSRDNNIVVYGEIEFPAHAAIWKSVYPEVITGDDEFDMGNPKTHELIKSALDEIISQFGGILWHMGHDEISQPNSEIENR